MMFDPDDWSPPLLALIGLGMERGNLGLGALRWIERAEVLAGGRRLIGWFPEHRADRLVLEGPLDAAVARLKEVSETRRTVVLASGDPLFFGIGRRLVKAVGKERLFVFPNVTSVQYLFSRLGKPWEDVKVVSLHGRNPLPGSTSWLAAVHRFPMVAFLTDPSHTPAWIASEMVAAGCTRHTLIVGEDLGLSTERIEGFSPVEAAGRTFSALNVVVACAVEKRAGDAGEETCRGAVLGLPESAFRHEAGLITKTEIRAVVLAHLRLEPGNVLWDLGAGSGSVSIEAARLAPLRQVIAVEKNPDRYEDLIRNIREFHCHEVQPVCGCAAEAVEGAPDPDRVFIGGSGGELLEILEKTAARLKPGGRVVQTAVTLDTLDLARSFWQGRRFDVTLVQLQVSRSVPIGKALRLEALNPVFIIVAADKRRAADDRY